VGSEANRQLDLTEKDLHRWRMLQIFEETLEEVFGTAPLHPTFGNPRRKLGYKPYLSLSLFGLINPVVKSMRGLISISKLSRVQEEICQRQVSLGSFSEMQGLLDPALLHQVFQKIFQRTPSAQKFDPRLADLNLIIQDGSLWSALPRMVWAEYGGGCNGDARAVRLHLRFNLLEDKPQKAKITNGKICERQALRQMYEPGEINVGDRYYGEDYQLFEEIHTAKAFFVLRIKEGAVVNVQEEIALTEADKAAGVVRHAWVQLGSRPSTRSIPVRLVEIRTADQHIVLVTNLPLERAGADLIGLIYHKRWGIELFFRWIKCVLGCRHFFAESRQGVTIQLYLALIASLLFQCYSGRRPDKRSMELIQLYLLGWATREELIQLLQEQVARQEKAKKQ